MVFPRLLLSRRAVIVVLCVGVRCVWAQDPVGGPFAPTIAVSGFVQLSTASDDKKLPPDIRIAVDCHGVYSDGGVVALSGQFRFVLTPDPIAINGANICNVTARLFGDDSTTVKFPVRSNSGIVSLETIVIQRNARAAAEDAGQAGHAGATVSATSLKAPPDAVRLFARGQTSLQKNKFAEAVKSFEGAVKIYPEYAEAWLAMGSAQVSLGALGNAREAFLKAAQLDPQMAGPPAELGLLAVRQNDVASAARYLDQSLHLDPAGTYQTCYSDALVNLVLKRYDVAERSARAALRFGENADHARVNYVLGIALLARGANQEAKQRLLRYLELAPAAPEREQVMKELARVEQLNRSTP